MSVQVRGKSFQVPAGPQVLSVLVPSLLDFVDQTTPNSRASVTNLTIKSAAIFDLRIKDYTTSQWTDQDSIPMSGSLAIFSISDVNILDIEITPSFNDQPVYVYLSGEV